MAQRSAHPVVPIALLVFGLVAILLLTVPTEDVQEAPGFMVRSVARGIFGSVCASALSCPDGVTKALPCGVHKTVLRTAICGTRVEERSL